MKPRLKIDFSDFWPGFDKFNGNFFRNILSEKFDVIISSNPDFLIYSNYGNAYLKYKCIRIFFSAENQRPDFSSCDFAITFDYIRDERHYRFPLCALYYIGYVHYKSYPDLISRRLNLDEAIDRWRKKTKFCCIVISNAKAKKRIRFFKSLSRLKNVDSGGRALNNIGHAIGNTLDDKINFLDDYKFVIAFENSSYPGYATEKILEPFFSDCIPIYWGDPLVKNYFNGDRFINYNDFASEASLIQRVKEIDEDDFLAASIIMKPIFAENILPQTFDIKKLLLFLEGIIAAKDETHPVAQNFAKSIIHSIMRRMKIVRNYLLQFVGLNYR